MRKWIEEKLMMMNNIRERAVIVDTRASSVSDSMSSKEGQMTPSLQKKMPKKGGGKTDYGCEREKKAEDAGERKLRMFINGKRRELNIMFMSLLS